MAPVGYHFGKGLEQQLQELILVHGVMLRPKVSMKIFQVTSPTHPPSLIASLTHRTSLSFPTDLLSIVPLTVLGLTPEQVSFASTTPSL
jgi:hypothetical protein